MIEIKNVHKWFGANHVLRGVDLEIQKGETLVIIGRSGCGKSVLLKHIIAILEPDEGDIRIDGRSMFAMTPGEQDEFRLRLGMLFQGAALFDSLNVRENVGFSLYEHTKLAEETISARVKEKLGLVGLSGIEDLMPSSLSGGMKKRVGLARAICSEPEIILYDEPTTGLDPINADVINDLILRMQAKLKVTSIVVTHDMTSAYKVGNRIAMLYEGKIIGLGTPDEIRSSRNPVIRQFITGSANGPITNGTKKETENI
ncbi:MAG TPA: ABC transporter ATP-binding protein [Candidatus Omnitrophota bacterium]|jgi:phospholipid/cholesterol/gamma-HCH transport system ATP-binding protein|nr:MAG: putative ABC transporter ATP-binding protein [Candidatus Omnitrophica bacterium ADurb.Bin314]HOE68072.1 ABC transporter ATP-binding protein [Candidatus Omnitrophota bacterium]HQB94504.1 ABC transporter ATP-binding protein [Candidatus Omnitrophota bacterium]